MWKAFPQNSGQGHSQAVAVCERFQLEQFDREKNFYFIYSKEQKLQYYHLAYIHARTTHLNWENFGVLDD